MNTTQFGSTYIHKRASLVHFYRCMYIQGRNRRWNSIRTELEQFDSFTSWTETVFGRINQFFCLTTGRPDWAKFRPIYSPIRRLFTLGSFLENYRSNRLFSTVRVMQNFEKKWVGLHFGRFKKTHLVTLFDERIYRFHSILICWSKVPDSKLLTIFNLSLLLLPHQNCQEGGKWFQIWSPNWLQPKGCQMIYFHSKIPKFG
jgi:hypothetical protein